MSRYAYHAPSDPLPRAVTNGGQNVINLGGCPQIGRRGVGIMAPQMSPFFVRPVVGLPGQIMQHTPPTSGATSTVAQPPPFAGPIVSPVLWGGMYVPTSVSPAPSPTVGVSPTQTAPTLTNPGTILSSIGSGPTAWYPNTNYAMGATIVDSAGHTQMVTTPGRSGPGPTLPQFNDSGFSTQDGSAIWTDQGLSSSAAAVAPTSTDFMTEVETWLGQSTLISGLPNWGIAGAGAIGLYLLMGKRGRR